jgi:tetratricopeptide (TPR) repeat protein
MKRAALIVAVAVAAYANAVDGSFHFDDAHAVQENPSIRSLANLGRFFSDVGTFSILPQNQGYRPLLLVTYALTAAVTGVNPRAFIAVNLLVHILCALLLYLVVAQTLRWIGRPDGAENIAWLTALLFAVHPIQSECINYVSARSESLSSALMLASLYAYLRARDERRWIGWSVLAIAGALLTKPTVTIFPLILVAFEAAAAERQSLRQIAPRFAAVTAAVVALGLLGARMTPAFAIRSASNFTRGEYFRSELPAIWHYVRLFLLPVGQSGDPNYPSAASFLELRVIAGGAALLAVLGLAVYGLWRRRGTGLALAAVWFLVCLFPASSIFPLAEIVNEHRPYLAVASLCALVAVGLIQGIPAGLKLAGTSAQEAVTTIAVVLLLALAALTVHRNQAWHNEETFWADIVAKSPDSTRAQMNYGLVLMSTGRLQEAEPRLREALRLAPYYSYAHVNLAQLLTAQGKTAEAITHFDLAIQYGRDLFWGHYYRGLAAERLGEPADKRVSYFAAATELSPAFADAWYHLSLARDAVSNVPGALEAARHAMELRGSYDDRFMLAYLLLKVRDAKAAKPLLDGLHAEHPEDGKVNWNLAYADTLLK